MGRRQLAQPDALSTALARVIRAHLAVREDQLTQTEIGDRVGVSQSLVSSLLLGQRDFTVQLVTNFAKLIEVKPHELIEQAERLQENEPLDQIMDISRKGYGNATD